MQTRFETEIQMFRDKTDSCQRAFSRRCWRSNTVVARWEAFFEEQIPAASAHRTRCLHARAGRSSGLAQLSPFTKKSAAWQDLMALPTLSSRVDALNNAATRATLIAEGIASSDMKHLAPMLHPFGNDQTPDLDFERKASFASARRTRWQRPRRGLCGSVAGL